MMCGMRAQVARWGGPAVLADWRATRPAEIVANITARCCLAPPGLLTTLLGEWAALLAAGRRLDEVCI